MKSETLNFDTANGETIAYAAVPDNKTDETKAVILIHEWWGLTDHIKDIAGRYADEGFVCIAPDLYRGKTTTDAGEASKLMEKLEIEDGVDTIKNAIARARDEYGNNHFGITGFCMGGTYTVQAACRLEEGISAAAAFYGDPPSEDVLKDLAVPLVFSSGRKDEWITPEKVEKLEKIADENELDVDSIKYEAGHAFFNDTRPEAYDETSARDAWAKVIGFFNDKL